MNRLAVVWLLVLTSGVLCDPGRGRGGPWGGPGGRGGKEGKGCMKKMMPPIQVSCDNGLVSTWVSSIFSDNTAWFEEKAKEKRLGPDYYTSYSSLLAGLQNNICLMRLLEQRSSPPNYCSQYTNEQLMDCPDMDEMGDMGKMMMKKMKSKMCNMDVRKGICKLYQDKKMMKKIEEKIVWDYMMWTDCSDINENTLRADFINFWADPSNYISTQMNSNTGPSLETLKIMKECFPHFAAKNLGQLNLCSMVSASDRNTMQRKPSGSQSWMRDQIWSDKQRLLNQAYGDSKKYMCLVYYKVTADRSAVLGVDMDMGSYSWFKDQYKNVTKRIKSQLVWQSAQSPTPQARTKAQQILNGQWSSLTPPTWMTQGRAPTFPEWKAMMEEKVMVAYELYNSANTGDFQYRNIINNITQTLEAMFGNNGQQYPSYMPRPDYKKILMEIWEENKDNSRLVPIMIKAKVDKIMELKMETDVYKKYEKFMEKLMMYVKEKKMEALMANPDCNSINNIIQYRTIAGYIVSRNWAQLEATNWPTNLNKMQEKTIKACIANEVYNRLGTQQQCLQQRYSNRRTEISNFVRQLEANTQISKWEKKTYIMSKMMQRRNSASGLATMCDLYFLVSSSSSLDANEKKMHFGKMLGEIKKILMKYDSLVNLNTATCPDAAKRAVFEMASKMKRGGMRDWDDDKDWDDDDEDWDDDDEDWEDDDEEWNNDDEEWDDDDEEWDDDDDDMDGGRWGGGRGRGPPGRGRGPPRGGPPPGMMGMMKGKMMGMMKKKGGDKMKMCPSLRNFKTCTDKLTCAYINEKYNAAGCTSNTNYTMMTQSVDRIWNAIQQRINSNMNFDFMGNLSEMAREIKKYDKEFAPCVLKYVTQKLRDYWGRDELTNVLLDECAIMQKVIKMKMMSKWDDDGKWDDDDRDDWDRRPQPPRWPGNQRPMPPQPPQFQGNGGPGGPFMPQRPQPPFNQQPQGRFSFNNWRGHPQGGQWNRQQ